MALVRCPKHKIPYNADQARGCPACAREEEGDVRGAAIQELAKASKVLRQRETDHPPTGAHSPTPAKESGTDAATLGPEPSDSARPPSKFRWMLWIASGLLMTALAVWLVSIGRPRFVEARFPAAPTNIRPLPFAPNAPIASVFAALGVRQPRSHPETPQLARYEYGADLTVDALNGVVYAITIAVPSWSWRGINVGLPLRNAEGALALLGPLSPRPEEGAAPENVQSYAVYASVEDRPRANRRVEVRPPNGCFDVFVELRPQVVGLLVAGERRLAVTGRAGSAPDWVVTRVQVVSRALPGVGAGSVAC